MAVSTTRPSHAPHLHRIMSLATVSFGSPHYTPRYRSPEDADLLAKSSECIFCDREEVDHLEPLLIATRDFLQAIQQTVTDEEVQHILAFVVANGTVHVSDCIDSSCKRNGRYEEQPLARMGLTNVVVDIQTNIFGLIGYGMFYPLMGIFDILHKRELAQISTQGNEYFHILWNPAETDSFFCKGLTHKLCVSTKQCSDSMRHIIFRRNDIILNDNWLIFERYVDSWCEEERITKRNQVPILFSNTGKRFNWIHGPSRRSLEEHLHSNNDRIFGRWEEMNRTARKGAYLTFYWKKSCLIKLLSIPFWVHGVFSEITFDMCLDKIALACPVNVGREGKYLKFKNDSLLELRQEQQLTTDIIHRPSELLSSEMHSKVSFLNEYFEDQKFMNRKPKFHTDLDVFRQRDFDNGLAQYNDSKLRTMKQSVQDMLEKLGYNFQVDLLMGPRSRESRQQKVQIINDLFQIPLTSAWEDGVYEYFKSMDSPANMAQEGFGQREGSANVVMDGELWPTDVDSELLRALYYNLDFYMSTLPGIAWDGRIASFLEQKKIRQKLELEISEEEDVW